MSEHAAEAAHPEIPIRAYFMVWGTLIILTAITVGAAFLDMGKWAKFTAMLVATGKAALVVLYFMHLRYERGLIPIIILVTMASFGVFLILTFTDYPFR